MSVDREQIRRDAADKCAEAGNYFGAYNLLTLEVDALLAELEQAEEEADQLDNRLDAANLRLAKVPALVEAAQNFFSYMDNESYRSAPTFAEPFGAYFRALEAALAAWEQE